MKFFNIKYFQIVFVALGFLFSFSHQVQAQTITEVNAFGAFPFDNGAGQRGLCVAVSVDVVNGPVSLGFNYGSPGNLDQTYISSIPVEFATPPTFIEITDNLQPGELVDIQMFNGTTNTPVSGAFNSSCVPTESGEVPAGCADNFVVSVCTNPGLQEAAANANQNNTGTNDEQENTEEDTTEDEGVTEEESPSQDEEQNENQETDSDSNTSTSNVTAVSVFSAQPFYQSGGSFDPGVPGLCVVTTVQSSAPTNVRARYAPYITGTGFSDLQWMNSGFTFPVDAGSESLNFTILNGISAAQSYIIELVEILTGQVLATITPGNATDSFAFTCSPNTDGTFPSNVNCGNSTTVLTECTASSMSSFASDATATISDIVPGEETIDFNLSWSGVSVGDVVAVSYTTDANAFVVNDFTNVNNVSFTITASNQTNHPIQLTDLNPGTVYYITVQDSNGYFALDANGQNYTAITTTGANSSGSGGSGGSGGQTNTPGPGNIQINVNNANPIDIPGENINQGLVQCGFNAVYDCDFNKLLETIDRVLKFLIYIIVLPLAAILFAIAGIKLIIAREKGKEAAMSDAKALFGNVVVGLALALGAWIIVKFILVVLGYTDASGVLTQILGITTTN